MLVAGLGSTKRFRILRQLGEGGMGVVYAAEDRERDQVVALKTFKLHDSDALFRFKREFRTLADLSHPNLVQLYDLVIEKGSGADGDEPVAFFTMEIVEGVDFVSWSRGDEQRLRDGLVQLARGLHALHSDGTLHRDIKPSNVLVTRAGRVVLLDFGLAVDVRSGDGGDGRIVGTPEYMAPEQAGGDPAPTPACDWYSVGALMYEALTGTLPFAGPPVRVMLEKQSESPPPPRERDPSVPEDLDALCAELLAVDAAARPDGEQVLHRLGAGGPPAAATTSLAATPDGDVLTGRDAELARLMAAFDDVTGGAARAVLVRGPSGIGKSTLVRGLCRRLDRDRDDVLVLGGRCYEREDIPYKAIDSLVDNLSSYWRSLPADAAAALVPREAAYLPRLFPVLGRVPVVTAAPELPEVADPRELRTRAFAAFRELLDRLAERTRLVLHIDDMQWVDADTVALLADVLRPPDPPPLLLVLAARPSESEAPAPPAALPSDAPGAVRPGDRLEALVHGLGVATETITLAPLTRDDAVALAGRLLGGRLPSLVERVAAESLGSPFFLGEIVRYLQTVDADTDDAHPSLERLRLDDVLARRVGALGERTRHVLELVCLAGEPVSRDTVARAAAVDGDAMTRELRALRATSFARTAGSHDERIVPYHDRIREVVLAGVAGDARAGAHRALAIALAEFGGSDEQRARHWQAAGEPQRAARHARAAAERAAATLDFDRAAELYRVALTHGRYEAADARELWSRLGEALSNAGRPSEAADAFTVASKNASAAERLELQRRSASELLRGGFLERGLDAIRAVLDDVGMSLAPTPRRALWSLLRRRAWLAVRGLRWRERSTGSITPDDLTRVDVCWSVATGLSMLDHVGGGDFQSRHLLLALRAGERGRVCRALALEAAYRAAQGSSSATTLIARAEELADAGEDPYVGAVVRAVRGLVRFWIDYDWRGALDALAEAERSLRVHHAAAGWEIDTAQYWGCMSLFYLGDLPGLARRVPRYVREAERRGDRYALVNLRTTFNILYLVRDEPEAGAADLEEAIGLWTPPSLRFVGQHVWFLVARCRVALYTAEPERAAALLADAAHPLRRSLLMRVPWIDTGVSFLRGRVAVACGDRGEARRQARRLAKLGTPMSRAYAGLLRAAVVRAAGDEAGAAAGLRDTARRFEELDAALMAAMTRRRLGQTLGGDEGAALTAEADAWLGEHGVARPAAFAALLAPGW